MVNEASTRGTVATNEASTNAQRAMRLLDAVVTPLPAETSAWYIGHDREQATAGTDNTVTVVMAMLHGE